jgi:putative membrane protein
MGHDGPGFPPAQHLHHGWSFVHVVVPLILFLIVIGVVVWAVLYLTSHRPPALLAQGAPPPRDPAMEELRIRYARGDLARDDFVQRSADLGGAPPEPLTQEPPTQEPPAASEPDEG